MSGISAIVAVPIQIVTQQPYPEVTYDRLFRALTPTGSQA